MSTRRGNPERGTLICRYPDFPRSIARLNIAFPVLNITLNYQSKINTRISLFRIYFVIFSLPFFSFDTRRQKFPAFSVFDVIITTITLCFD